MTSYPKLKSEFLHWLKKEVEKCGCEMTIHGHSVYEIQSDRTVIGLVRASVDRGNVSPGSGTNIRLSVDPEHDIPQNVREEADKITTTVLDAGDRTNWDSARDNFYPLNRGHVTGSSDRNSDGEYQLALSLNDDFVQRRKNRLYYLCSRCGEKAEARSDFDSSDTQYNSIIEDIYE